MATPGFGFSAGDFISAINIIIDVSKALKDAGGASAEYQAAVTELNLLRDVLTKLQAKARNGQTPFEDYAKQQVNITLSTLSAFLSGMSKFDAKLGSRAPSGWHRGAGRKAQWALKYAKEIEKLRSHVGLQQMADISSMLQELGTGLQCVREKLSSHETSHEAGLKIIQQRVTAQLLQMQALGTSGIITRQASTGAFGPIHAIEWARPRPGRLSSSPSSGLNARAASDISEPNLDILLARLDDLSFQLSKLQVNDEGEQADRLHRRLEMIRRTAATPADPRVSERLVDIKKLIFTVWVYDLEGIPCRPLADSNEVARLAAMTKGFGSLLSRTWWLISRLVELIASSTNLSRREPVLLLSNSIHIEDALGRKFTLQFEYFRCWSKFQAFIHHNFQDLSGELHVVIDKYHPLGYKRNGAVVPQENWYRETLPRHRVSISIEAGSFREKSGYCLRPGCVRKTKRRKGQSTIFCLTCRRRFYRVANEGTLKPNPPISRQFPPSAYDHSRFKWSAWRVVRRVDPTSRPSLLPGEEAEEQATSKLRRIHIALSNGPPSPCKCNLLGREQDAIVKQAEKRLSQCALDFIAKHQIPFPQWPEQSDAPPERWAWRRWVCFFKKLVAEGKIDATMLYGGQFTLSQFMRTLEASLRNLPMFFAQGVYPLMEDRDLLQLLAAGVEAAILFQDALAVDYLDRLHRSVEEQI